MKRRIFSIILALAMAATMIVGISLTASAAEATTVSTEAELLAAIEAGGKITLGDNIQLTNRILITTAVELDLAGKTITGSTDSGIGVFYLLTNDTYSAELTINDSSDDQSGKLYSENYVTIISQDSKLVINSGTVESKNDCAIIISGAALDITGGKIVSGYDAVTIGDGVTANISGGEITGANSALYCYGGTVTVSGDAVISGDNYTVYNNDTAVTKITGGTVKTPSGASTFCYFNGTIEINGGSFPDGVSIVEYSNTTDIGELLADGKSYYVNGNCQTLTEGQSSLGGNVTIGETIVPSLPITVGDFTVSPTDGSTMLTEGTDYSYTDGELTVSTTVPVTVGMRDGVTATNHVIAVDSTSGEANITFTGISVATTEDVAITVEGGNKVTFTFSGSNALKAATDGIEVASNTPLAITGADNGELSISDVTYGISQDGYTTGGSLTITGNIEIDIVGCTSHAIYYRNTGSVTVSEGADVNIDTTKYAIYAHGINVSGGTVTVKNDDGYAICGGSGSDIMISGSSVIHIIEAERGIYTDGGKITITDSANVMVYGGTDGNKTAAVVDCAIVCDTLLIDKNAVVEAYTAESAISGGLTTITDNATVIVNINCTSSSSKHAIRFDSPLTVSGNALVDIDISGSKIYGLYDITDGTANISGNAVVSINGAYRSAYVDFLNLSDSACVTFEDDLNYAVYGEITLKNSATFTATSTSKKVLYDPFTVTPESGKAYMVKAGASAEDADTYYYNAETKNNEKSAWRYFHASVVDVYTVTVDRNIQNGKVSADQNTKAAGEAVTLTVTPDAGYELDALTVKDANGDAIAVTDNVFTMPAGNVTVSATFKKAVYSVKIETPTNGTVTLSPTEGIKAGDEVTITVTPDSGYKLVSVTVTDENGAPVPVTDNKFTMPAGDVSVTATFAELGDDDLYALVTDFNAPEVIFGELTKLTDSDGDGVYTAVVRATIAANTIISLDICDQDGIIIPSIYGKISSNSEEGIIDVVADYNSETNDASISLDYYSHEVVIEDTENGTVTVDKTIVNDGETVTITVTPDSGYVLNEIRFKGYEIAEVIKGEKYTVTIPNDESDYQLFLIADFIKNAYTVTVDAATNGTVESDRAEAVAGETVTLTVTPSSGFVLDTLTVKDASGNPVDVADDNTFIMPEGDVTVTATFSIDVIYMKLFDWNNRDHDLSEATKLSDTDGDGVYTAEVSVTITENMYVGAVLCDENGYVAPGELAQVTGVDIGQNKMMIVCFVFEYTPESQRLIKNTFSYEVTVIPGENGTVTTDKSIAEYGSTVTVLTAPERGYVVGNISVIDVYGNPVAVDGNTFIMPDSEVSVEVSFVRRRLAPVKVRLNASVVLEGGELEAIGSKFELSYIYNGKRVVIETITCSNDGSLNFAPLVFQSPSEYTFYIRQIAGEDDAIVYDGTVYEINTKVTYDSDGDLALKVTKPDNIIFNNVYTASVKTAE